MKIIISLGSWLAPQVTGARPSTYELRQTPFYVFSPCSNNVHGSTFCRHLCSRLSSAHVIFIENK